MFKKNKRDRSWDVPAPNLSLSNYFFVKHEQIQQLKDPQLRKRIEHSIVTSDQTKIRNEKGDCLFHELCRNDLPEVRMLAIQCLITGFDINTTNGKGSTGLHFAALHNDQNLARILLERGIDPSFKTLSGDTVIDICLNY
jgi:ankyrin repeat protein